MKRIDRASLAALLLTLITGCDDSGDVIVTMTVDHGRSACFGAFLDVCLQVAEGDKAAFENFYDTIDGFEPVLGHRYRIRTKRVRLDAPPADASGLTYHLEETLSDELVPQDSTFAFRLVPSQYTDYAHLEIDTETTGHLLDGTPFTGTDAQIDAIRSGLLGEAPFTVVFGYDAQYRLVVNQVL